MRHNLMFDIIHRNKKILENRLKELETELDKVADSLKSGRKKEIIDKAAKSESALIQGMEYERKSKEMHAIRNSMKRIKDGTYGECINCGKIIDRKRLEIKPTAKFCITCRKENDKDGFK